MMFWFLRRRESVPQISDADEKVQRFCKELAGAIRDGSVKVSISFTKPSMYRIKFKDRDVVCEREYHNHRTDLQMTIQGTPVYRVNVTALARDLIVALACFDQQERDQRQLHEESVEQKKREEMAQVLS